MPEPTQLNVNFSSATGEPSINSLIRESQGAARDIYTRKPRLSATLGRVIRWIEEQDYDDFTKQELIKVAKSYPVGALNRFKMTAKNHLARIQDKKRGMDKQGTVKQKAEIDVEALKEEDRRQALEYKILRAQQKQEEDILAAQQQEEELKKLAAVRHQQKQQKKQEEPQPEPKRPTEVEVQMPRAPSGGIDLLTPNELQEAAQSTLADAMREQGGPKVQPQSEAQPQESSQKMEFAPPPEIEKSPEEAKAAMENRRAFALRMKQIADEEDQGDNYTADEEWMT